MWWAEDAVPKWIERSLCAAFLTIVGFFAALFSVWCLGWIVTEEMVPDRLGAFLVWHPEAILWIAVACGVALAAVNDWLFFVRRRR